MGRSLERAPAREQFRAAIPEGDAIFQIDDNDGVAGLVEEAGQLAAVSLSLLTLLPLFVFLQGAMNRRRQPLDLVLQDIVPRPGTDCLDGPILTDCSG